MGQKKPNLVVFGIDSLRRDHMSAYGYHRLTTPHLDRFAKQGVLFEQHFSPSIPTTPAYASMLTGMDTFGTDVVALRHAGPLGPHVKTLPEVLGELGYNTTCIGFTGNPSSRGFQKYIDYESWQPDPETGRSPKAQNLNDKAVPELERLAADDKPFFLFLRHMDPHSPYLPPVPYERMFYGGDEKDPNNKSMEPVYNFKPFADFLKSWIPEGVTDHEYVTAQYDGAVAYMDACIQTLLSKLEALGLEEDTVVVVTADHGETLYEHDCYFDHHGLYDCTLVVPLIIRFPGRLPAGKRVSDVSLIQDIMPTVLELLGISHEIEFDGRSLIPAIGGEREKITEFYITECTWMRKHGWRTPEWKLICALEPDFHFKPEVELYNLIRDPGENVNLAEQEPEVVKLLQQRMEDYIAKREAQTGRRNPIYTNTNWHGTGKIFTSSQEAYDSLYIGSIINARSLQQKEKKEEQASK